MREGPSLSQATQTQPLVTSPHANLADTLHQVITAVPHLVNHPALAYAAATSPGNVVDAAHGIAGLQLLHSTANGILNWAHGEVVNQHMAGIKPENALDTQSNLSPQNLQPSQPTKTVFLSADPSNQGNATYGPPQSAAPTVSAMGPFQSKTKQSSPGVVQQAENIGSDMFGFVRAMVDPHVWNAAENAVGGIVKQQTVKAVHDYGNLFSGRPINPASGSGPVGVETLAHQGFKPWVMSGLKAAASGAENFQKIWKTYEYINKTQGNQAAMNYLAQLTMIALGSVAVTKGVGIESAIGEAGSAPDIAANITLDGAKGSAPDVVAQGMKEAASAPTGEAQSAAMQNAKAAVDLVTQAKNKVFAQAGLDTTLGVRASTVSVGEINTMLQEAFRSAATEASDVTISKDMQSAIYDHLASVAGEIVDARNMLTPFRVGMQTAGEFSKPVTSTVGKMVSVMNKAMNSKTLLGTGVIAPEIFKQEYAKAWNASSNEMTIGQAFSSGVGFGKNSVLSGTADFVTSLLEPQFMLGRSMAVGDKSIATVENLDKAFTHSPRYINALRKMRGMSAGEIQRVFDHIPPKIAEEISKLGKDATIQNVHNVIRSGVEAVEFANPFKIPRMGIYGLMKAAKLSDGKIAEFFSHTFAQQAIIVTEKGIETNTKFLITDPNAVHAIGQNLASAGVDSKTIKMTLDDLNSLLASGDVAAYSRQATIIFKNAFRQTLHNELDDAFMKSLSKDITPFKWMKDIKKEKARIAEGGLTSEERKQAQETIAKIEKNLKPYEKTYDKLRQAINEFVDNAVGDSGSSTTSKFNKDLQANDISKTVNSNGENILGSAILFNERGELHFVKYQEFGQELRKLISSFAPELREDQQKYINNLTRQVDRMEKRLATAPLPSRQYNKLVELRKELASAKKIKPLSHAAEYKAKSAHSFFEKSDLANKWVNDKFFKPLALLTPGWALRVSTAEGALNIARLGPLNFAAGVFGANLQRQTAKAIRMADLRAAARGLGKASRSDIEKELFTLLDKEAATTIQKDVTLTAEEKLALNPPPRVQAMMTTDGVAKILTDRGYGGITRDVARNIAMFTRGMIAGVDRNILRSIGHEEFIKAATLLAFQHDGWLPDVVDARHHYPAADVDVTGKYSDVKITRRGTAKVKTKTAQFGETYKFISFTETGYYEAWKYGALKYASDEMLGNPLAKAYRDLIDNNPKWASEKITVKEAQKLHDAAVEEARTILNGIPKNQLETMDRYERLGLQHKGMPATQNSIDSWAEVAVRGLESKVRGMGLHVDRLNGYLHRDLLNAIANQSVPSSTEKFIRDFGTRTDKNGKLKPFKEEQVAPEHVGKTVETLGGTSIIQKASTLGHQKVLGPIVNHLVRQPTYIVEYVNARKQLQDLVDRGIFTSDQADLKAQVSAAQNMIRFIHNPMDKTHFEENMRVVAPFYFAQNQAWRRMGRLFSDNPGAFMQYAASMLAATDWVSKTTGNNGISLFNFPGSALLWGVNLTLSTSSLQTINPLTEFTSPVSGSEVNPLDITRSIFGTFRPSWGPIVSVPAHVLLENFGFTPNVIGSRTNNFLQDFTMGKIGKVTPLWEAAVPNSILRPVVQAAGYTAGLKSFGFDTALMQAVNQSVVAIFNQKSSAEWEKLRKTKNYNDALDSLNKYQANLLNPQTDGYEKMLSEAKTKAYELWATKIIFSLGSPVSVGIGEADQQGRATKQVFQKLYDTKANPFGGEDAFYRQHPNMFAVTIGNSRSTLGNYVPETKTMFDAISNPANQKWINKYRLAAYAYIGGYDSKDTAYYQPALAALVAVGQRARNTPEDFIHSLQISIGNQWYYNVLAKEVATALKQYPDQKKQIVTWENAQLVDYGTKYNPTWYNEANPKTIHKSSNLALESYNQLLTMMKEPEIANAPKGTKFYAINQGLKDFQDNYYPDLQNALAMAQSGRDGATYSDVRNWWLTTEMPSLLKDHPQLQAAVDSVLSQMG